MGYNIENGATLQELPEKARISGKRKRKKRTKDKGKNFFCEKGK